MAGGHFIDRPKAKPPPTSAALRYINPDGDVRLQACFANYFHPTVSKWFTPAGLFAGHLRGL
jgi:hypothetical protein